MRFRTFAVLAAVAAAAATAVPASPAQAPAKSSARAAVVSGTLGDVAPVQASGNDATSRSAPSRTPKGIVLGGGSASASASIAGGDANAEATAEASEVELLGGVVKAERVRRSASHQGVRVVYAGSVTGLAIGDETIGDVRTAKRYELPGGEGFVVVNTGGKGLSVTLTGGIDGFPTGTSVAVADVDAQARDGKPEATPTPTATATAPPAATPTPTATAGPGRGGGKRPRAPSYRRRLMSRAFVFPVRGATEIGGPFGSFRADTGSHQGNDLFADFGTPVVAVADGTVENVGTLPISGNRLWVYADTGDQFFYAHISAFAPDAIDHRHVRAGTVLGYVGNTGDAEPTPPHLHFEIHPDGGAAVDPKQYLVAWQKRAGAATADSGERPGALVEVRDLID